MPGGRRLVGMVAVMVECCCVLVGVAIESASPPPPSLIASVVWFTGSMYRWWLAALS